MSQEKAKNTIRKIRHKIPWLTLIGALLLFAAGLLLLFVPTEFVETALYLAMVSALYIYGAVRMVQNLSAKKTFEALVVLVLCWGFGTALLYAEFQIKELAILPSIFVGAVSLLLGIVRLVICVNCIMNRFKGRVRNGVSAFFCLAFGVLLVVHPIDNFALLATVAAFYLMFYAVTMFGDAFAAIFHADMDDERSKRRTHFALPNLLTAIKPSRTIKKIRARLEQGKLESGVVVEEKAKAAFDTVNLEVMIHLTTQGLNKFGHVDIAIGDTVYSYGTYDSTTVKYGGFVSQGSFIEVPKAPYLRYCLDYQQKYVIGFGACLSEQQLAAVQKHVDEMRADCAPLESPYEQAIKEGRDGSDLHDSASNLVRDVGGKVYTVLEGPYKRYFGININCVQFADWLLSESGIDAMSFSGIRTPGAYYAMMDNMFRRKNTRVIRRTWYVLSKDIEG